jgi:hypothetical protein
MSSIILGLLMRISCFFSDETRAEIVGISNYYVVFCEPTEQRDNNPIFPGTLEIAKLNLFLKSDLGIGVYCVIFGGEDWDESDLFCWALGVPLFIQARKKFKFWGEKYFAYAEFGGFPLVNPGPVKIFYPLKIGIFKDTEIARVGLSMALIYGYGTLYRNDQWYMDTVSSNKAGMWFSIGLTLDFFLFKFRK